MTDEMRKRISSRSFYDARQGLWSPSMLLDEQRPSDATVAPLVLSKELDIRLGNAWLVIATGRDDKGKFGHRVIVRANGKHIPGYRRI